VRFTLLGPIRGGKNHVGITRTGKRYPLKPFVAWREGIFAQLRFVPRELTGKPCIIRVRYFAGDKRKRDVPAMMDALFHCFERSGLVKDDALLCNVEWTYGFDRKNPRTEIEIEEING